MAFFAAATALFLPATGPEVYVISVVEVRTKVPPESLILGVQEQIHHLAPDLAIFDIRTMQQGVHGLGGLFIFRLAASLAGVMGALGLVLATVGVYGVVRSPRRNARVRSGSAWPLAQPAAKS